jgi:hypothetical protein
MSYLTALRGSKTNVSISPKQKGWGKALETMRLPGGVRTTPVNRVGSLSCSGTGFNTQGWQANLFGGKAAPRKGELVAVVANHSTSHKVILPGVGSMEQVVNVDREGQAKVNSWTPGGYSIWVGQLGGLGVEENVKAGMKAVREMVLEHGITRIYLHAWSRGTEACFQIANQIAKDPKLADVELRIFAHDPVPGPGRFGKYPPLPSIVTRVSFVLASDDTMPLGLFNAILPDVSKVREVFITTMPTNHAGATGIVSNKADSAIGRILRDLVEKDYQEFGGLIDYRLNLSNTHILNQYATIAKEKSTTGGFSQVQRRITYYEGLQAKSTTVGDIRLLQLPDQSNAWVNSHHLLVFKEEFPDIYRAFVEGKSVSDRKALENQILRLHNALPTTFLNLKSIFELARLL